MQATKTERGIDIATAGIAVLAAGLLFSGAEALAGPLFAPAVHYPAGDYPQSVAIGGLDGDLVPDLVVADCGTYPSYDGDVSVLLGLGDGTFAAAVDYAIGEAPRSVAIGDLDGDQVLDLAVANTGSSHVVWQRLGAAEPAAVGR